MRARDNPFASARVLQVRYRLPRGESWDGLLDRLARSHWRGALVGPHGSGKTTLLEDFVPRLMARGFIVHPLHLDAEHNLETLRRWISQIWIRTCSPT